MRYVIMKNDIGYPDGIIPEGTIFGVGDEVNNSCVYILTGQYRNLSLHTDHFEEVDLLEQYQSVKQQTLADNENIGQLMLDNKRLNETVERLGKTLVEQQKKLEAMQVVLPKAVADAIDFFKNPPKGIFTNWCDKSIIDCVMHPNTYHESYEPALTTLRTIDFNLLLKALVNGYTVEAEETAEDKLFTEIHLEIKKWYGPPSIYITAKDMENLAKRLVDVKINSKS